MEVIESVKYEDTYVTDSLDYGFDSDQHAYVHRGKNYAELMRTSSSKYVRKPIAIDGTGYVDLVPTKASGDNVTEKVDAEIPRSLNLETPRGRIVYKLEPDQMPARRGYAKMLVDVNIDSSTTISSSQKWTITVDVGDILKSAVIVSTRAWATDAFTRRYIGVFVGIIPNLPVYKFEVTFGFVHDGIVNQPSDSLSIGCFFSLSTQQSSLAWHADRPEEFSSSELTGFELVRV